ncbi:MAG: 23S rRNA (pseudouridine(1915)-N(3))-methyltransferase RlmH [Bacteroidaceae bacterium]|nr:23S rRNA (pseudouridine(1915)-N(3))-methyltransferase RlmH [Bacteroidaceae bacterium]
MKTRLLVVGRTTDTNIAALCTEYIKRTNHYIPFEVEVVPELKNTKSLTPEQQKEREAELIQKSLQTGDYVVLLDEHGKEYKSTEFASWMEKRTAAGHRRIVFIIGGPYGFAPSIHTLASEELSLSKMTFSHQMIRLLFIEQVYRAMTILRGEPYHHE